MIDTEIETFEKDKDSILSLPIRKKDLGNFVTDLLGQQQSIEKIFDEKFNIDFDWIINLHDLIDQRINQQNHSDLVSFNLVFYFENGLKRTLTSVEALKSYIETKKYIPVGFNITWIYLAHFPNKPYPEKQQISFSAFRQRNKDKKQNRSLIERYFLNQLNTNPERSFIRFQINHTARTWGDDLEVVMSNHIDEAIRKESTGTLAFNIFRSLFSLSIMLFGMVYGIISTVSTRFSKIKEVAKSYTDLPDTKPINLNVINEKLDLIARLSELGGYRNENFLMPLFYMFGSMIIAALILEFTKKETHSFIVISKKSEEYRYKILKKEKRSVLILIGSFLLSIIASIIANYGYDFVN